MDILLRVNVYYFQGMVLMSDLQFFTTENLKHIKELMC